MALPTAVHKALQCVLFFTIVGQQISQVGLVDSFTSTGAATFYTRGRPDSGTNGSGEGDSSGSPLGRDWPALVVEASVSQSLALLREDVRWWFSASDHGVKIVLLLKFSQSQDQLVIEKWEEDEVPYPPGPITRSRARQYDIRLVRRQEIIISRDGTDPVSYKVDGGALVLEFKLLFLRDPDSEQGEGDVVMSVPRLQRHAEHVWGRAAEG